MTKPVSLFEIVDHKYCKICRRSTMGKNIEKGIYYLKIECVVRLLKQGRQKEDVKAL